MNDETEPLHSAICSYSMVVENEVSTFSLFLLVEGEEGIERVSS